MKRPRILRPQRKRVFLGCEGESERGYGRLLGLLLEAQGLSIFIDTFVLQPGSGDPLELVKRAKSQIERREKYAVHAILLDSDRRGDNRERAAQAEALARRHKITLIWQDPCHEAFLLRHLEGGESLRPPTAEEAMRRLRMEWANYAKAMPASRLADRLDHASLRRAATVEPDLANFLTAIGLDPVRG